MTKKYSVALFNAQDRNNRYYFKLSDEQLYLIDFLEKEGLLANGYMYSADDIHEYIDLKKEFEYEDDY